mgnify:CR=1 FL=1
MTNSNDFLKELFYFFWGSIFIIPKVSIIYDYYINGELFYHVIGNYQDFAQSLLLVFITIVISYIVIKNWRVRLVKILLGLFSIDFFIFGILGFGLHEAYIFPGNYQFVFPLLLGVHFTQHRLTNYHVILVGCVSIIRLLFTIIEVKS